MDVQEVFLSHSSEDAHFVEALAETLRNHGIPVWLSSSNLRGAQEWHDEIGAALNRCDWFAIVLSTASVTSMWVKREVLFALRQSRYAKRIIPIVRQPCDYEKLSWTFGSFEMIDFSASIDDGLRELFRVWGIGFDPRLSAFCCT